MRPARRILVLALVVGAAIGCSATSTPSPLARSSAGPALPATPTQQAPSSLSPSVKASASPLPAGLPAHQLVSGPNVAGAFDLATDGTVIAWSSGAVDVDAPALWSLDAVTGKARLAYRSPTPGAILANLAVSHGTYAFAEVTPRAGGSRTWRLLLLDPGGRIHVLDTNDVPESEAGMLPMAAISDRGVMWATNHRGDGAGLRCEIRYASLTDLRPRVVASEPCSGTEFWYPRSDGRWFAYGTVEYPSDGASDERHVCLVDDADLADLGHPRRLDADGQASLPAILDKTVVWKVARRDLNMFSPAGLVELDLATAGGQRPIPFPSPASLQLTTPSIGPRFIVGEDATGVSVTAWDRDRATALEVDRLAPTDPGFISGTRLSGEILAWFYTSSVKGGGTREIRWRSLPAGSPAARHAPRVVNQEREADWGVGAYSFE